MAIRKGVGKGSKKGPAPRALPGSSARARSTSRGSLTQAQQRQLARDIVSRVSAKIAKTFKDNDAFRGTRIQVLSASDSRVPKVYSTGVLPVDVSTNCGGFPMGRVTILHGPESSGKTIVLIRKLAETQRLGGLAMFVDCERKLNFRWAETLGLDTESLIYLKPKCIEAGFIAIEEALTDLRKSGLGEDDIPFDIGWDSLHSGRAARTVIAGFEGSGFSPETKAYSDCITLVKDQVDDLSASFTAISQVRMNIGASKYQPQTKIGVGKAVLHAATLIGEFKHSRLKPSTTRPPGQDSQVVWRKNHVANPFGFGTFRVYDGIGIDRAFSIWSASRQMEIGHTKGGVRIELVSGTYAAKSEAALLDLLDSSPDLMDEAEEMIRDRIGKHIVIDHDAAAKGEISPDEDGVEASEDDGGLTKEEIMAAEAAAQDDDEGDE